MAEEQQDQRYSELRDTFNKEADMSKSLYAYRGFGRSTEMAGVLDEIGERYQRGVEALNQVIDLENRIRTVAAQGGDVTGLSQSLSYAEQRLQQVKGESQQKRLKLVEAGNLLSQQARERLAAGIKSRGGIAVQRAPRGKTSIKVGKDPEGKSTPQAQRVFRPFKKNSSLVTPQKMRIFNRPLTKEKKSFSL